MQTGNGKTSLELNILHGLCTMEEIAEKKAKIYARLLIEPSLTSEMEKLSQKHKERRNTLERLLYGKPLDKEEAGEEKK